MKDKLGGKITKGSYPGDLRCIAISKMKFLLKRKQRAQRSVLLDKKYNFKITKSVWRIIKQYRNHSKISEVMLIVYLRKSSTRLHLIEMMIREYKLLMESYMELYLYSAIPGIVGKEELMKHLKIIN